MFGNTENPNNNPGIKGEKIMITNDELHKVLINLKDEGISYKYVAKISGISYDTFYYYRRCKQYPLDARIKIETALRQQFGGIIDEYCK